MSEWTDENKEEVVARYKEEISKHDEDKQGQVSTEICKDLAKEFDKSTNGVRVILSKAGVYVKKTTSPKAATSAGTGAKRINKAQALDDLKSAISSIDEELIDEEIIGKLTGKAAQYFTSIVQQAVALQG
jgi:hypothetical protein